MTKITREEAERRFYAFLKELLRDGWDVGGQAAGDFAFYEVKP